MNEPNGDWYTIDNICKIDSPALVVFPERVKKNIDLLISMIDDVKRLRPHVKTHKSKEAAELMIKAGISKFKCATIAEAEMLAMSKAADVLLAYQPVAPKIRRFISLIQKYPGTKFSCLVDNIMSATTIANAAFESKIEIPVFIDLNVGMNRTGIKPGREAIQLYKDLSNLSGIKVTGLHAYDGHVHSKNFMQRSADCEDAYKAVAIMQQQLSKGNFDNIIIVAGGSPTFPFHAKRKDIECSPGTFIYWDKGYEDLCSEQNFLPAALIIARVISLPGKNKICIDLGHKSISAEKEINNRVFFLNAPELTFISQSEEHLVAETDAHHSYKIGDILYGLPFHICPTVALYERAITIINHEISGEWKTIARDRKINI